MGENVFYPWKEYKQFDNTDGVGEITTSPRPWYNSANVFGTDGHAFGGKAAGMSGHSTFDPSVRVQCFHVPCGPYADLPEVLYGTVTVADPANTIFTLGKVFQFRWQPFLGWWQSENFPVTDPLLIKTMRIKCQVRIGSNFDLGVQSIAVFTLSTLETTVPAFSATFSNVEFATNHLPLGFGVLDFFDFVLSL